MARIGYITFLGYWPTFVRLSKRKLLNNGNSSLEFIIDMGQTHT